MRHSRVGRTARRNTKGPQISVTFADAQQSAVPLGCSRQPVRRTTQTRPAAHAESSSDEKDGMVAKNQLVPGVLMLRQRPLEPLLLNVTLSPKPCPRGVEKHHQKVSASDRASEWSSGQEGLSYSTAERTLNPACAQKRKQELDQRD
jgi:hypothetical protein